MAVKHEYPACAIYRGGKCSCDESDKICPNCGSEEWDRITDRTSPGASFNRCNRCGNEWEPKDSAPQEEGKADERSYEEILEEVRSFTAGDGSAVLGLASKEAGKADVPWDNFPAYLIDKYEGETITEERLQRALAAMLQDPRYASKEAGKVEAVADERSNASEYVAFLEREFGPSRGQNLPHFTIGNVSRGFGAGWQAAKKLYLRPSQQALSDEAKDALRYRWLREVWPMTLLEDLLQKSVGRHPSAELDKAIDSAILAAGGTK